MSIKISPCFYIETVGEWIANFTANAYCGHFNPLLFALSHTYVCLISDEYMSKFRANFSMVYIIMEFAILAGSGGLYSNKNTCMYMYTDYNAKDKSGKAPFNRCNGNYSQSSNIRQTESQDLMFLVSPWSCLFPIHWSNVSSRERRSSWSSTDRRYTYYIWGINSFFAY